MAILPNTKKWITGHKQFKAGFSSVFIVCCKRTNNFAKTC